ncbi:MAG: NAD-dependent epimerase/dehydratase family protein [Deltaproteobacteria bacterium]|nr:NAD-dependent epimerase/dehydratase family protein [Deltaproteobacteria bacterium]
MSERVLVTGGAGFIGSHVVDRLLAAGYAVRVLDSLHPQVHPGGDWPDYLDAAAERVRGDVRDARVVDQALDGIDVVLHQAARVGVGQSQYEIEDYLDVNVRGTGTLLEGVLGRRSRVRKLVVASSMSTYGEGRYRCPPCARTLDGLTRDEARLQRGEWDPVCPGCGGPLAAVPTDESTPLCCASVYALSKRMQEELVLLFGRTYGIPAVALRYFNTYGPRQALANPYTGVAAIFLARLKHGQPPVAYEDGRQLRDFVSVHDVAAANLAAVTRPDADGLAVNVGSGQQVTVLEIAAIAARHLGCDLAAEVTGRHRKGDVRHCFADVRRLAAALGHTPRVSVEAGFAELAAWAATAAAADHFAAAQRALRERGLL